MTHWEYPEAVERFGRQLVALGIATELQQRGAEAGDLVMVDKFDFEFSPGRTSVYIPPELLEKESMRENPPSMLAEEEELAWRPFPEGGYLDVDVKELMGFNEYGDWDLLDDDEFDADSEFAFSEDEVWTS
jgi:GTP-binding protein